MASLGTYTVPVSAAHTEGQAGREVKSVLSPGQCRDAASRDFNADQLALGDDHRTQLAFCVYRDPVQHRERLAPGHYLCSPSATVRLERDARDRAFSVLAT